MTDTRYVVAITHIQNERLPCPVDVAEFEDQRDANEHVVIAGQSTEMVGGFLTRPKRGKE